VEAAGALDRAQDRLGGDLVDRRVDDDVVGAAAGPLAGDRRDREVAPGSMKRLTSHAVAVRFTRMERRVTHCMLQLLQACSRILVAP
jgi:hypothetical protein